MVFPRRILYSCSRGEARQDETGEGPGATGAEGRRQMKTITMVWFISVALVSLWLLGLAIDEPLGGFIHVLYAAAILLLVVNINQEVRIHRRLRQQLRSRG